jgi:hypothetical protein
MDGPLSRGVVQELAGLEPGEPVLSIVLRTDPRDPANTAATPAWLVALRNGLRAVAGTLTADIARQQRRGFRQLQERVERDLLALEPAQRARGLALFVTASGSIDHRVALQLPPREHVVRWDRRPFISPLVDVADRGRPAGLVLVAGDAVRVLHWEAGRVHEPDDSLYELELGDWRQYAGYAMANPARRQQTATHVTSYEQRVDEWRRRFLTTAARGTAAAVGELGWTRILIAAEGQATSAFMQELPMEVTDLVVAEVEANLLWEEPAAVADRVEPALHAAWERETRASIDQALTIAGAGGLATIGVSETLDALVQARVAHLVFDPTVIHDPAAVSPTARSVIGEVSGHLLAERAVELAIASAADVSSAPPGDGALADGGGMLATLRF